MLTAIISCIAKYRQLHLHTFNFHNFTHYCLSKRFAKISRENKSAQPLIRAVKCQTDLHRKLIKLAANFLTETLKEILHTVIEVGDGPRDSFDVDYLTRLQ